MQRLKKKRPTTIDITYWDHRRSSKVAVAPVTFKSNCYAIIAMLQLCTFCFLAPVRAFWPRFLPYGLLEVTRVRGVFSILKKAKIVSSLPTGTWISNTKLQQRLLAPHFPHFGILGGRDWLTDDEGDWHLARVPTFCFWIPINHVPQLSWA
jgi:hypothetical protein